MNHKGEQGNSATSFAKSAGDDLDKWGLAVGHIVTYVTGAVGTIARVDIDLGTGDIIVFVEFDHGNNSHRRFKTQSFRHANMFSDMRPALTHDELELAQTQIRVFESWQAEVSREEQEKRERDEELNRRREEARRIDRDRRRQSDEAAKKRLAALRQVDDELKEIARKEWTDREAKWRAQYEAEARQRRLEQEDAQHFADLKTRYLAQAHKDESPAHLLYPILLKIDAPEPLSDNELEHLKAERLFGTLALYYERIFEHQQRDDPEAKWNLVRSSAFWRQAKFPGAALRVTDVPARQDSLPNDLRAAILTTRGGAYRDQGELRTAEECGRRAISLDSSTCYPYNLLGGVYIDMKDPQKAEEYFNLAQQQSGSQRAQEVEIRTAIQRAGMDEKRVAAEYLLRKDPERYAWARVYLKGSETLGST